MNVRFITLAPYAWRAFQQRAKIGLLADDLEALYKAGKPLWKELANRWPAMNHLARSVLAEIMPEKAEMFLEGSETFVPDLRWGQQQLKLLGLYHGEADNKNGPETVKAIAQFQRQAGFDERNVDGLWGPVTAGALMARPQS